MPSTSPQTVKLKSTLRLLIPRLRNAQKKDTAISISARREMAELLAQNREQSARIRVENIIHTDITVELMEILELYAELLLARAALLDVRDKNIKDGLPGADDTGLEEAAASIIYSAPRIPRDVRELGMIRSMLMERFGKEFAIKATDNVDDCVPKRVVDKLKVDPPKEVLVTAYLEEIARTYGVDWPRHRETDVAIEELGREVDDEDDGVGGGQKEPPLLAASTPKRPNKVELRKLSDATTPSSIVPGGAKSPVSIAPPGPRSDNPNPSVRLPGGTQPKAGGRTNSTGQSSGPISGAVPTVDDLAKRFSALKR